MTNQVVFALFNGLASGMAFFLFLSTVVLSSKKETP